tara:strand:- start:276 stop:467 length:192 start_codon:yes stop_codon:yes gene_type:complete
MEFYINTWNPCKEIQNLQKIVAEKKFEKYFSKNEHAFISNGLSKYKISIRGKEQNFIKAISGK